MRFRKTERLCSRKLIEELFGNGNSFFCFPLRTVWIVTDQVMPFPAQMTTTVSSRHFKKAVTRNLIKRRIREAYRKKKEIIYTPLSEKGIKLALIIQYVDREVRDYATIEKAVQDSLGKLSATIRRLT
ncbi:MAG: ribonuclease P protein component [Bacteroidales bacterium]|nr:ribonuclease P protein component [Bacteroidales bacterium]